MILTQFENFLIISFIGYKLVKEYRYITIFGMFLFLFALFSYTIIGIMVDNIGALLRYRSAALFFLLLGICCENKNRLAIKTTLR